MARKIACCLVLLSLTLLAQERPYDALRRQAEAFYAEKSFSRAHDVYEQAAKLQLTEDERRWVEFRLADTAWRNDAASPSDDPTVRNNAQRALEELVRREGNDRIRAEANESLGDYFLTHRANYNPHQSLQYYLAALDYWAGSDDVDYARKRYLGIVWRLSSGEQWRRPNLPKEIYVNALTIAQTPEDRARARFLLAQTLMREGPAGAERALEHLEILIKEGRTSEWYDDALMTAARMYQQGTNVVVNGQIESRANFARALELYRRLVNEFPRGTTPYREEAERAIRMIIEPGVGVTVTSTFLPDSEQEIVLTWRNVKQVKLTISSTNLVDNIGTDTNRQWFDNIKPGAVVRSWTYETNDDGAHTPGAERIRLEPRLPVGAYVVTAEGNGKTAQHLVLVTDAHILVHASQKRVQVFVSDVLTGQPIANARVRTWHRMDVGNGHITRDTTTNASGLAEIQMPAGTHALTSVTTAAGARQAFHHPHIYGGSPYHNRQAYAEWRIYAFTDRPAYRPNETVQWKFIARVRDRNERWITPAGRTLKYMITDPRGEKVKEGDAKLNDFGSFFSELPLTASMPLGVYSISFSEPGDDEGGVAHAALFRLEEYKLPEFLVRVTTNDENGNPRLYRLGQSIDATIEAEYYFGGPVANATVEAVIYQQPYIRYWYPWREYSWYFPPIYEGEGAILKRETLRTDAAGRATVRIDTNADGPEMLYRIEARVVDSSRREVVGSGSVKVTKQRYAVIAHPEHFLHRPGEQVEVKFKAIDANDQPVQTTGTVRVVRREWRDTQQPRFVGYREEEVMTSTVKTDANGEATFTFTPKTTGYYAITWTSEDRDPDVPARVADLVTAETTVWVADRATVDTGYRPTGGVEVIVDKETLRAGQNANVMIATPASGRWIVLTTTGDDILDTQVVRMDGTVKLVQIPLDERHVPDFHVTASSVFDRTLSTDTERVLVPPVEHFLDVEVKSDREEYRPRDEGTLTITTRDVDGKPVRAEVAVAVTDDAVTAIQSDLAPDPRQFFYGDMRASALHVTAGLHVQQYVRLVRKENGQLVDDRYKEAEEQARRRGGVLGRGTAGYRLEAANDMAATGAVAPPPPPAPVMAPAPASQAVSEAITVTASAPQMKDAVGFIAPEEGPAAMNVEVRTDFRSTAFWQPNVLTDANGTASVKFRYPEATTTWRATARAASAGSQFGMGTSTARTRMPLIVRLQSPRFFVAGDRVVVSAVLNNNTDAAMRVTPSLEVEGLTLANANNTPVDVPANGETRVEWTVNAERAGTAKLRVSGRGAQHGDAMERTFIVYEHGIDKLIARSGKMRADEALVKLDLPRERRATELVVQVAPSLATTMLDALPYLIEFPYGCTEQTMSRFLPAAIVARTLKQLGAKETPAQLRKLDEVTRASIARLYDMQHDDGGWGWWKEGDSDEFMTAYVVWGFALARDARLGVNTERVERGVNWLEQHLVQYERDPERQAWMLHALSAWDRTPSALTNKAFDNIYKNRERLSAYARALLALAAHRYGRTSETAILVRNLEDGVKIDRTPDQSVLIKGGSSTDETMATAHWGARGFWWRWYESPVESTAFVLQALVNIDPKHRLIEPAMNWLVKNRRGAQWSNTRDTAIAVLSLNDYLLASGETLGNVAYEVSVNGRVVATKTLSAADALSAPSRFSVDPSIVNDATQEIRIRRTSGTAALYFSAEARFVSLEEPVKAAGNELFVKREYYRLKPKPTLLKGVTYDKVLMKDRDTIASGERVEVVVTIETKNDYEYLLFEDLKPAGFEAVELQSGSNLFAQKLGAGNQHIGSEWIYQELRDRKVALFANQLSQGIWEIRYTLRAETPGSFHALPLLGLAMYVPDIRANSDETRVEVSP